MDFEAFSRENKRRCESPEGFNHSLDSWSMSDWFMAVMGELGEAANFGKKLRRIQDGIIGNKPGETVEVLKENLKKELADTYTYLDLLATSQGLSMGEIVVEKFLETSEKIGYQPSKGRLLRAALISERNALIDRLKKIRDFLSKDGSRDEIERSLMEDLERVLVEYISVVDKRAGRIGKTELCPEK